VLIAAEPILSDKVVMRESKICAFALMSLLSLNALSASAQAPSPPRDVPEAKKLDQRVQELYKAGKYSDAVPLVIQSLDLREKTLGPEPPSTGGSLSDLGRLYMNMGDYAKVEPLFQRALKINEKALGPEHPDTFFARENPRSGGSNAISNAIGYAKFFSRSHHAVIRVYDEAGNVIETHEHTGDFKEW
jgi:tetratricopeptide (TPR) repeat protein